MVTASSDKGVISIKLDLTQLGEIELYAPAAPLAQFYKDLIIGRLAFDMPSL
jgi:hypothetical protein